MFWNFLKIYFLLILNVTFGKTEISPRTKELRLIKSLEIREIMNATADPCVDFYEFACGKWETLYPVDETTGYSGFYENAIEEFFDRITGILKTYNPSDTASEIKIKNFYKSCEKSLKMSTTTIRSQLKSMTAEFGKMPALLGIKWNETNFNWLELVGQIANKYGKGIFLTFKLYPVKELTHSYMLNLNAQTFVLKDTSEKSISNYAETIEENLIDFLGTRRSYARRIALNISKFEATLLDAYTKDKTEDSTVFHNMTNINFPSLNLTQLTELTFGYIPKGDLYLTAPQYTADLVNIIKKTPKKTVANYIFYHLLLDFSKDLPYFEDSESCVRQTIKYFKNAISKMAHHVYQLENVIMEFRELWQEMKSVMQDSLEADVLSWYDDEAREHVLEKLHMMKLIVDSYENYDLDEEYKDLSISPSHYMENIKKVKALKAKNTRDQLDLAPDLVVDYMDFSTPLYAFEYNAVFLPASALLTSFLMISDIPKALKYARSGTLYGHEIMHAYGGDGRFHDKLGMWVGSIGNIEDEFESRRTCIRKQYESFDYIKTVREQNEDQDENIADIAGIALAYAAYMRWLKNDSRTKEELELESMTELNYTKEQLFFIYYSQTWCAAYNDDYDKRYSDDLHAVDPMRAVLPLMNFDKFAEAFKCPIGSRMNPEKKCLLT